MTDSSRQEHVGHNARVPHNNKKKMVITASILMATVPGAAIALSASSHQEGVKPTSISVHTTSPSPADTITTEVPSPDVTSTTPTGSATSGDSSNSSSVSVTVNGQAIDVPENGTVNQTIPSADGDGSVDVKITGAGTSYNSSYSSTSINYQSNHSTNGTGGHSSSYSNVNQFTSE